jgi:hypothetical protein
LKIHQDKYDDGQDYLVYRGGEMEIPTETIDEIVALKTSARELTEEQERGLIDHLQGIISEGEGGPAFVQVEQCASFIMNEANQSREQMARLVHWRQAHRQAGEGVIHGNCPICEEGKRKTKGFKRNQDYRAQVTRKNPPYHRLHSMRTGMVNRTAWAKKAIKEPRVDLSSPVHPPAPLK